jgi:hypothetical protein
MQAFSDQLSGFMVLWFYGFMHPGMSLAAQTWR